MLTNLKDLGLRVLCDIVRVNGLVRDSASLRGNFGASSARDLLDAMLTVLAIKTTRAGGVSALSNNCSF